MSNKIAVLNDEFCSRVGLLSFNLAVKGSIFCTPAISALPPARQAEVCFAVTQFKDFEEGNDYYGEHDFGAINIEGAGRVFWKIDYYADEAMDEGCEDPADPLRTFRVPTIMLSLEYWAGVL